MDFFSFHLSSSLPKVSRGPHLSPELAMFLQLATGSIRVYRLANCPEIPVRNSDRRIIQTLTLEMDIGVEDSVIGLSQIKDLEVKSCF